MSTQVYSRTLRSRFWIPFTCDVYAAYVVTHTEISTSRASRITREIFTETLYNALKIGRPRRSYDYQPLRQVKKKKKKRSDFEYLEISRWMRIWRQNLRAQNGESDIAVEKPKSMRMSWELLFTAFRIADYKFRVQIKKKRFSPCGKCTSKEDSSGVSL